MLTFVCQPRCRLAAPTIWRTMHNERVLVLLTKYRLQFEDNFTRAIVEQHVLRLIALDLHEAFPGSCFSKEQVLESFSHWVLRFNAWTYLTKLPGVRVDPDTNFIYVPSVLKPGICKVLRVLCFQFLIYLGIHDELTCCVSDVSSSI